MHEYILNMWKLAAKGEIEETSVIRYIVEWLKVRNELKTLIMESGATVATARRANEWT